MTQKFEFRELEMKGAYEIIPFYATDIRGGFIKDYNIDVFNQMVLITNSKRHSILSARKV